MAGSGRAPQIFAQKLVPFPVLLEFLVGKGKDISSMFLFHIDHFWSQVPLDVLTNDFH